MRRYRKPLEVAFAQISGQPFAMLDYIPARLAGIKGVPVLFHDSRVVDVDNLPVTSLEVRLNRKALATPISYSHRALANEVFGPSFGERNHGPLLARKSLRDKAILV
jgi:hypothetical protein